MRPFHLAALFFVAANLMTPRGGRPVLRVVRSTAVFSAAIVCWLVFVAAAQVYHQVSIAETVQQAIYAGTALSAAGFFAALHCGGPEGWKVIRWSALVALGSFGVFFLHSARSAGIDPIGLVVEAVRSGDPGVLQFSLYRPVFGTGSGRHEVFAALLVMMWVSVYAQGRAPLTRTWRRLLYRASVLGCAGAVVISLSRAIILALALAAGVYVLRSLASGGRTGQKIMVGYFAAMGLCVAAYLGLFGLLGERFVADTASYSERAVVLESSLESNPLVGTPAQDISSHNFVLDSWLRAGLLGALAATMAFVAVLVAWGRTVARAMSTSAAGHAAMAALVALPVVRLMTAGGGVLHLTEWLALGFFGGYLARRQRRSP